MKQGLTYQEADTRLRAIAASAQDYIVDTRTLTMDPYDNRIHFDDHDYTLTNHAHQQIAARLDIPKRYYDRMRAGPRGLLAENVNTWFQKNPEHRMLRTVDNRCRAFLSDRFRRIDNFDIIKVVSPILREQPEMKIVSCDVNENRFYLKALFPRIEMEPKVGDPVQAGICLSNSETGMGQFKIEPLVMRLVCLNGMVCPESGVSRRHVGSKIEGDGEDAFRIFRTETMEADDKALMMKIEDVTRAATQEARFVAIVDKLRENAEEGLKDSPVKAVQTLAKKFVLTEREHDLVFTKLAEGQDYTTYGMIQAVTAAANEAEDYDRATFLERLGGQISTEPELLAA